jgi:hypothetical protein
LAGRIAAKLGDIALAQQYFNKNHGIEEDEASIYYAAKAYLDNQTDNVQSPYQTCLA